MKGIVLNISPTVIKNKLLAFKNEMKEYYTGDNVFQDDKTTAKAHLLEFALVSVAALAVAGIALKMGKNYDLPKLPMKEFRKTGVFKSGCAYYKGEPFSGKIIKYFDNNTVSTLSYYEGKLRTVTSFDSIGTRFIMQKRYMYDSQDKINCIAVKEFDNIVHTYLTEGGGLTQYRNGKLSKVIRHVKDGAIQVVDYSNNPKGSIRTIARQKIKNL